MSKHIVVLTGAGISAESGIPTFRDSGGLWENHDIESVATPEGWARNPERVLKFYNARRRQLKTVTPNAAHQALVELESKYRVDVITQNVDDLHERAGSTNVMHLHGELTKVRSERFPDLVYSCHEDINMGDQCEKGHQLRPHVVWFGEEVPMLESAAQLTEVADIILVIGSSMQVYPAAGLVSFAREDASIFYIDQFPTLNHELQKLRNLTIVNDRATVGVPQVVSQLLG